MRQDPIQQAVKFLQEADGLLITAGAGMGVDSGLPDFRGPQGFWGVYPALGRARLQFEDIANPQAFVDHPRLAWGFYGHRLKLYRQTTPHAGFQHLQRIAAAMPAGAFVFTSNVDGHFQRAGFPAQRVCEVHGSIHHLQCLQGCREKIWSAAAFEPEIDEAECLLLNETPHCPQCGGLARPNILMFGDWGWLENRQATQYAALQDWLETVSRPVVIEIGAGTAIPTLRHFGERLGCPLIRINLQEPQVTNPASVGLAMGGLAALNLLVEALG